MYITAQMITADNEAARKKRKREKRVTIALDRSR